MLRNPLLYQMLMPCLVALLSSLAACRYVMWVTEQLGPVDSLVPPPPSLTRYKKELAVRAEASPKSAK